MNQTNLKSKSSKRDPDKTREAILQSAYEEIYVNGFQSASLENILNRAGVTKGALYHHFANKLELGYAVVDDIITPFFHRVWVEPLGKSENPIDTILEIVSSLPAETSDDFAKNGCPWNNLCQEMSPLDEKFRRKLSAPIDAWREALTEALRRGKVNGQVAEFVNPKSVAAFVVAILEGFAGLVKNSQSHEVTELAGPELFFYLNSLRSEKQTT